MGKTKADKGNGSTAKDVLIGILLLIMIGGLIYWAIPGSKEEETTDPVDTSSPSTRPAGMRSPPPDEARWFFEDEHVALDTMLKSAREIAAFDSIEKIEEEAVNVLGKTWVCSPGTQQMQNELYVIYRGIAAVTLRITSLKTSASQQIVREVLSETVSEKEDQARKRLAEKLKTNTHKSIEAGFGIRKTMGLPSKLEGNIRTTCASDLSKESIDDETTTAIKNLMEKREESIKTIKAIPKIDASLIETVVEFRTRLLGLRIELKRALSTEPNWLPAYRDGNASMRQDDWKGAIRHYSFAASICGTTSNRIMLDVLHADALRREGNIVEAVKLLEDKRRDKKDILPLEGYTVLGRCYLDDKNIPDAQRILEMPWHEKLSISKSNPSLRKNLRIKSGPEREGLPEYSWMIWLAEAYLQEALATDNKIEKEERANDAAKALRFALDKLYKYPKKWEPYWKFAEYARKVTRVTKTDKTRQALPIELNAVIKEISGMAEFDDKIVFTNASGHLGDNDDNGEGLDKDRYAFELTNVTIKLRVYEDGEVTEFNITAGGETKNAGRFRAGQEWTSPEKYDLVDGPSKVTIEVTCEQGYQKETEIK